MLLAGQRSRSDVWIRNRTVMLPVMPLQDGATAAKGKPQANTGEFNDDMVSKGSPLHDDRKGSPFRNDGMVSKGSRYHNDGKTSLVHSNEKGSPIRNYGKVSKVTHFRSDRSSDAEYHRTNSANTEGTQLRTKGESTSASRLVPGTCQDVLKTTNTSSSRFVLGWLYFEQLTMATNNLFSLMWYSRWWQARAVMPFTHGSRLYGLPHIAHHLPLLPLSLLYDVSKLDQLCCEYNLPPMADFEEFLSKASRNLVVVHFMYYNDDLVRFASIGGTRKHLLNALHTHHIIECCNITYINRIVKAFTNTLGLETRLDGHAPFHVDRCLCINASLVNEPKELLKKIGLQDDKEFTVIFNDWRGIANSDAPKHAPQGLLKNFRMFVPSSRISMWPHPSHNVMPTSSSVRGNATKFLKQLTAGKDFIAVHFRSEKLGQVGRRIPRFVETCFANVMKLRNEILSRDSDSKLVTFYFTDYGRFGSSTCRRSCNGAQQVHSQLTARRLRVTQFTPAKYKALSDSGFVAMVEQEVIASARTLILVGGGSFQSQIRQRFKKYRNKGVVYAACWDDTAMHKRM